MPIFEIETDQGVFEIDADREPTPEEAAQLISGQLTPSTDRAPLPPSPQTEQQAIDEFIKSKQAPFSQQVSSKAGETIDTFLLDPLKAIWGSASGIGKQALEAPKPSGINEVINPFASPGARNLAQTGIEAGAQFALGVGNQLNQILQRAKEDPFGTYRKYAVAPFVPAMQLAEFMPRTPEQSEIDQFLRERLTGQQMAAVTRDPLVPEVIGEANVPLAKDLSVAVPTVAPFVGPAGRLISRGGGAVVESATPLARRMSSPFRGEPVDPVAVEAATKKVQDLEFMREQNRINKTKTAEARNAQDLLLQEELLKAHQEAVSLGQQALRANQELGPQIEALVKSSEEALGAAQGFRGSLPAPQEASTFGTSMAESLEGAIKGAKKQANEDYSAVRQSLPETQPKLEASNLSDEAAALSIEESAGLQSLGDARINAVLKEASQTGKTKVPKDIQDLYNNASDANKAAIAEAYPEILQSGKLVQSWDDLQKTYQRLNAKIADAVKNQDGNAVRVLTRLKEAVSKDMDNYASSVSPETKALFDEANARFAASQEVLGTSSIGRITSDLALEAPETIVNKIVGNEKASVVNNLKKVLPPEKFKEVQSQYAERLMSPSKDVPFDPKHFMKQFDSINDETLKSVFGDDGFNELKKINQMSKDAIKAQELQDVLTDYNSKAQKAQDAYQKVKTSTDERRVIESARDEAEEAIDAIKDEKFKRDIEKARADLKAAQTPEKISLIVRTLYGLLTFGGFALTGSPVMGVAAGLASAAFGKVINRGGRALGSQLTKALEK